MHKLIIFILLPLIYSLHDFHISHTTLYYNDNLNSVEITVKVAIEDLEKSLQNQMDERLEIGTKNENESIKKKITNYFNKNLVFLINDRKIQYEYLGKELENNLHDIYLYFEINSLDREKTINSITIKNTLFLEKEPNQINIVLVEFKNQDFNLTFTKDLENKKLTLNNE
tara:strand:- start:144 stop:653 length:510 start_codon:yes stop_codon:yes gene_type:complete